MSSQKVTSINNSVQLEISSEKLKQLFELGVLCAADFRCLDAFSKKQVTHLCLTSCVKQLNKCQLDNTYSVKVV